MLTMIVATDEKNGIGKQGSIPWTNREDMKFFRAVTQGFPVVMGTKTYQSIVEKIGGGLPGRENIVLSRTGNITLQDVLTRSKSEQIFIIGGEEIYALFMPYADEIIQTLIPGDYGCDRHFPLLTRSWKSICKAMPGSGGLTIRHHTRTSFL